MKAAIYARYSSDNQREVSLDDQINACKRYAMSKDFIVDDDHVYCDAATSGFLRDRVGFDNLLQSARAKLFDVVLVDDLSKLSRHSTRTQLFIQELIFIGIPLHSVAENLDTTNEQAKLTYQLKGIINEAYIDDLRQKTIRGQYKPPDQTGNGKPDSGTGG